MFISVDAVRWVFTQSKSERSARLVLIAIATHCNDDGFCWPGLEAIESYTKLSRPTVLQALAELVKIGELTIEKGGRGPRDTNHYYFQAFMDSRVKKGKENEPKGKEEDALRVNTGLHEEESLEERTIEKRPIDFADEAIRESHKTGESANGIMKRLLEQWKQTVDRSI